MFPTLLSSEVCTSGSKLGLFKAAYHCMLRLHSRRRLICAIDSSFVKNVYGRDCIGRNPTDRGRAATKLSVLVDDLGVPLSLLFTPANCSDARLMDPTLEAAILKPPVGTPHTTVLSATVITDWADRIFRRRTVTGRMRNVVERTS